MNKAQEYVQARVASATTDKTQAYWQSMLDSEIPAWLVKQVESGKRSLADATPEGRKAKFRSLNAKKASKTRKANKKASNKSSKAKSTPAKAPAKKQRLQAGERMLINAMKAKGLESPSKRQINKAMAVIVKTDKELAKYVKYSGQASRLLANW